MISGSSYGFGGPVAMAVSGSDLLVANSSGNSLTEIDASTGALVQVIPGSAYGFQAPDALAVGGSDLFVANGVGNSVTEMNASTGGPGAGDLGFGIWVRRSRCSRTERYGESLRRKRRW